MTHLRDQRLAYGLSQRELARQVGCSGPHISDIENGKVLPSLRLLYRLARTLNIPESELLLDSITDLNTSRDLLQPGQSAEK